MPVSIVVGGQFGSEGKGKVALEIVRRDRAVAAAVRVGGTNSGHTAVSVDGNTIALRQLPAAAIDRSIQVVLPAGSYIDLQILQYELNLLGLGPGSVAISPMARIITEEHKRWEKVSRLGPAIGSTQSGTGASVIAMTARGAHSLPHSVQAEEEPTLHPFLKDTTSLMRRLLNAGQRVVIEGTQGFGLSLLQGGYWPKATSRDTSAAGFLAEAGLSPCDVDDVTMVIRCHPIRVAGDSGPLKGATTWERIAAEAGLPAGHREFTTVTGKVRRVGNFDPELVRRAILVNQPKRIVLNHLDYVDARVRDNADLTARAHDFVKKVEAEINQQIDWLGTGPAAISSRQDSLTKSIRKLIERPKVHLPTTAQKAICSTFKLVPQSRATVQQPKHAAGAATKHKRDYKRATKLRS
jgi:adenylosuccinate synthase